MGSFPGHALPGTCFILYAIWGMYHTFARYFIAKRHHPDARSYLNTAAGISPLCSRYPIEAILKILLTCVGMIGELATGFDHGKFTHLGNAQHTSMYFFFMLSGIIDILHHYRKEIIQGLDYVALALAFAIEGILFYHHLHGRSPMDVQVHMLLFNIIAANTITVLIEMYSIKSVIPATLRHFFILIQGTWFYQVGFILYPPFGPHWNHEDHDQMMIVTTVFTVHIFLDFVFVLLLAALCKRRVSKMHIDPSYQVLRMNSGAEPRTNGNANTIGKSELSAVLDSESEDV